MLLFIYLSNKLTFMNQNEYAEAKVSWSETWHQKPHASFVHWVIFLSLAFFFTYNIHNSIDDTYKINNQAAVASAEVFSNKKQSHFIPNQYIITFKDSVKDVPGLAKQLKDQTKGQLLFTYSSVIRGMAMANLPDQAVEALKHNPNIERVEQDQTVYTDTSQTPTPAWGVDRIDQRTLPLNTSYTYTNDGTGITVYIVDTGIRYTHTDFGGRAIFGFDALGGDGSDCDGHGTHVAGIAGGTKYGVAKGVKLVAVRVLGCSGSGSTSGVIAGLDWIAKNGTRPGVANMSLGGSASQSLDDAVTNLFKAGIVTAVAAGNSNLDACKESPARAPSAMTVGASDSKDVRANFSNFGSCVDWFAPGTNIVSDYYSSDTATFNMSGTSMATPHVTGVAALYLQAHPGATPQQVRDGLFAQATKAVITGSLSINNHLLYALSDHDNSWTPPPPGPPNVDFKFLCDVLICTFTDMTTSLTSYIVSWSWDFGNNTTSTLSKPTVNYIVGTYQVKLTAKDAQGQISSITKTITPKIIDVSANVTKDGTGFNQVNLSWSGANGTTVEVWKDSLTPYVIVPNTGNYTLVGFGQGSLAGYVFRICEIGATYCGKYTVQTSSDTTPPTAPVLSGSAPDSTKVNLSWSGQTDNVGVVGFWIYKGGSPLINVSNVSTYSDIAVTPGTSYSYYVTAFDATGNVSPSSNIVTVSVPPANTPPPPPLPPTFNIGDHIVTTAKLNVRVSPNGKRIGSQNLGASGVILDGPQFLSGYNWYRVDFTSGADGWVAGNYLK